MPRVLFIVNKARCCISCGAFSRQLFFRSDLRIALKVVCHALGSELSCSPFCLPVPSSSHEDLLPFGSDPSFSECLLISPLASLDFSLLETQFPLEVPVYFFFDRSSWQPQLPHWQRTLSQVSVISTRFMATVTLTISSMTSGHTLESLNVWWVQKQAPQRFGEETKRHINYIISLLA